MKLGETGELAEVTTSRIQFHERKGIIPAADRGANGYREYSAERVTLLRCIEQARALGSTPRKIADVEIGTGDPVMSSSDALVLLATKRESVTALMARARERERRIEALFPDLDASPQASLRAA